METISIIINDTRIDSKKGMTILEAAQKAEIYIPRLCTHPDLPASQDLKPVKLIFQGDKEYINDKSSAAQTFGGCQLCVVKLEGTEELVTSCNTTIHENMKIWTDLPEIHDFRQDRLMKILTTHPHACLTCAQREGCSREPCSTNVPIDERCCPELGRCELQKVAEYVGIRDDTPRYKPQGIPILDNEPLFIRNYELCIGCTRCVRVCQDVRGISVLGYVFSNGEVTVGSIKPTLKESGCKFCRACVEVCPTGALTEKDILRTKRSEFSSITLPPEKWLEFTSENIQEVPDIEGAFQLLDESKYIIFIQGTPNLHQALEEQLNTNDNAKYFGYEEDPMYTKKESELLQQFMQKFGRMPEGNEDLDDDLF